MKTQFIDATWFWESVFIPLLWPIKRTTEKRLWLPKELQFYHRQTANVRSLYLKRVKLVKAKLLVKEAATKSLHSQYKKDWESLVYTLRVGPSCLILIAVLNLAENVVGEGIHWKFLWLSAARIQQQSWHSSFQPLCRSLGAWRHLNFTHKTKGSNPRWFQFDGSLWCSGFPKLWRCSKQL